MRRFTLTLMAVLVAALALSACGESGPTKADYKKQFEPVNQQIKDLGSAVGDAVTNAEGKANAALDAQFADLSTQSKELADDVSKLEPPADDIRKNQDALVDALREAARGLQSISAAAGAGNAAAAKAATIKLGTTTSAAIKASREAIEQQVAAS